MPNRICNMAFERMAPGSWRITAKSTGSPRAARRDSSALYGEHWKVGTIATALGLYHEGEEAQERSVTA
jgi:hypothetical protein